MKPATLVAAALCVASVAAFAPKASGAALMSARSQRVAPPAMSMEVWSEKNIRLTLPLGVALPLAGLVTPPDSFGASVLLVDRPDAIVLVRLAALLEHRITADGLLTQDKGAARSRSEAGGAGADPLRVRRDKGAKIRD